MTGTTLLDVYVVDVCGTLVRDDTTLGLLRHHFARDRVRPLRYTLFRAMSARRSPVRLAIAVLEKLSDQHLLKHAAVRLLAGDRVEALNLSADEYAAQLLAQRRLGDVQHIGGLGHAADIDNLHEVLEAAQVHWRVLGQSV